MTPFERLMTVLNTNTTKWIEMAMFETDVVTLWEALDQLNFALVEAYTLRMEDECSETVWLHQRFRLMRVIVNDRIDTLDQSPFYWFENDEDDY